MYHHEKDIVDHYSQYLILYKRFIDDIEWMNLMKTGISQSKYRN